MRGDPDCKGHYGVGGSIAGPRSVPEQEGEPSPLLQQPAVDVYAVQSPDVAAYVGIALENLSGR